MIDADRRVRRRSLLAPLGDPWTRLGALGAFLAASLLFVHIPVSLWAGNAGEFYAPSAPLLALALAAALAGLLLSLAVLPRLPRRVRASLACLLCAIGLVWWGYGALFVGRLQVLNGLDAPMNFETALGAWELPLAGSGVLLLALGIGRAWRPAAPALLMLNVGLCLVTALTVLSAYAGRGRAFRGSDDPRIFRFSPSSNVLVVVLDGLQADVAARALADPALAAAFDGFQFYKDTLGAASTTFLSLPAIHSGAVYRRGASAAEYFREAIEQRSFMTRFAAAGYHASLINPIDGLCPQGVAACAGALPLLHSRAEQMRLEGLRLLDLSLFRIAPVWLKQRIYDDGNWFVSGRVLDADWFSKILQGNRVLREMARRFSLSDGPPTIKFIHSLSTHTPYVLADDCQTIAGNSLDQLPAQTRCALLAVAALLDRLKHAAIYDNTVILILADHGINPGVYEDRPAADEAWRRFAGSANPAFLLKLRGGRGALRDAEGSVWLCDVGATLCAATGACRTPLGVPAGQAPYERLRRFNQYDWRLDFSQVQDLPELTSYQIYGPLSERESWRRD